MPKTVLTVDDSASIRQMVSFTLKSAGYKVLEAHDGVDALDKVRSADIDLLLTDQNMPRMDGLSLVRTLRAMSRYQRLPILMLTTESSDAMKARGVPRGPPDGSSNPSIQRNCCRWYARWSVSQSLPVHRRKQWQST